MKVLEIFTLMWRDRFFTLLNVAGLAVGMAAAVLMFCGPMRHILTSIDRSRLF